MFTSGRGVLRRLKRWPTIGMKSFFISHSSIRCGCVSARQILSDGKGNSRSTTTERVAPDGSFIGPPHCRPPTRAPALSLPTCQLRDLNKVAASIVQLGNGRARHFCRRHAELGSARLDALIISSHVVAEEHGRRLALLEHCLLVGFGGRVVAGRKLQLSSFRLFG